MMRRRNPQLRVSLRTALPRAVLAPRLAGDWQHLPGVADPGMIMRSALEVDVDASAAAYQALHHGWDQKVAVEARHLHALAPDLVLTDVPYLPLAGAAAAGIPAAAICSLNWMDIYRHYCGTRPEAPGIIAQMLAAYGSAAAFLRLEPGMPMPDLHNCRPTGVVAQTGAHQRPLINARFGLNGTERLVIVTTGGIPLPIDYSRWPQLAGIRWLVDWNVPAQRSDFLPIAALGMPFTDLLHSCDALVTKPGYGSFSEAACNGIPLLYVRRHDWPEESFLVDWLQKHARGLEISRSQLERGDLADALAALWSAAGPAPVEPRGILQAAEYLEQWLPGCGRKPA